MNVTLLMVITPIDFEIAQYSIGSFLVLLEKNKSVQLVLYANGLDDKHEMILQSWSKRCHQIQFSSNRSYIESIRDSIQVGGWYVTDQGNRELREGCYESASEIWTRELVRLPTALVGVIDPDFEIFNPEFVEKMLRAFGADDKLGFFSTYYNDQYKCFESYSQSYAYIAARYATWFCIYRLSALEKYCNFTYTEESTADLPLKFDHSAKLQQVLIEKHGYHGNVLESHYADQFLHYSAFAKNRSLSGYILLIYRLLRIGRHNGWIHTHKSIFMMKVLRRLCQYGYQLSGMTKYDQERTRYLHE